MKPVQTLNCTKPYRSNTRSVCLPSRRTGVVLFALLASVAMPHSAAPVQAEDSVAVAVDRILDQITPFLSEKRLRVINVGKFESPSGTSAGPEIQTKFATAIKQREGFSIDRIDYDVSIRGRIEQLDLDNAVIVRVVVQIFDGANNKPIGQFSGESDGGSDSASDEASEVSAEITGSEAVPRLLGLTVPLDGDEDRRTVDQKLKRAIEQNPAVIKGSEVFAGEDSPYSVEILLRDGSTYTPVAAEKLGRRQNPFAEIPMDQVFGVRLNNYSGIEAAANLTLDGISCFAFSESRSAATQWLVPPSPDGGKTPGRAFIRGWDIDDATSFEFRNVGYPDSAAKELNIEPNEAMGQICVHFSESFQVGEAGSRSIGKGEIIEDRKQAVPREIGPLRATVQIRYERGQGD